MWPLSVIFLFATAAPQHPQNNALNAQQIQASPLMQTDSGASKAASSQNNLCFTMRAYYFRQQDGEPPVPAGMSTCTPAMNWQQRQISRLPRVFFLPLAETLTNHNQKKADKAR